MCPGFYFSISFFLVSKYLDCQDTHEYQSCTFMNSRIEFIIYVNIDIET